MWRDVSRAFWYCSAIVPFWPSRMRALPPMATTARRSKPATSYAPGTPRLRPTARRPAPKHSRGARVMPAPIWPTPASRWAMPVLMTGWTPVSTTRRTSMPGGGPGMPAVAGQREAIHLAREVQGILGRAAHETDDGRRRRHGEAADAGGLGDGAVAPDWVGVVRAA